MQNTVQRSNSVRFGSGILSFSKDNGVNRINLGALKGAKFNINKIIKELVFDNAKLPPKQKIESIELSATLYEIVLSHLNDIEGFGDYSGVDGTPETVLNELYGTEGVLNIQLINKNSNNSTVSIMEVRGSGVDYIWEPLIPGTDYIHFIGNGVGPFLEGYTYINITKNGVTTISVDYSYIPSTSHELIYKDVEKFLANNRFKFVNTDSNGKQFGVEFYKGYNTANTEFAFQPDESEDSMGVEITIKAYPDASNRFFRIFDEQDI